MAARDARRPKGAQVLVKLAIGEALLYVDQDFHCGHYRRVDIGPDQSLRRLFMPVTGRFDAFLPWVADVSQELTTPSS